MSAGGFFIPTLPGLSSDSTLTMYGGHVSRLPFRSLPTSCLASPFTLYMVSRACGGEEGAGAGGRPVLVVVLAAMLTSRRAPQMPSSTDPETDSHLYFFLIRNRHIPDTERTIIWSEPSSVLL